MLSPAQPLVWVSGGGCQLRRSRTVPTSSSLLSLFQRALYMGVSETVPLCPQAAPQRAPYCGVPFIFWNFLSPAGLFWDWGGSAKPG